MTEYKGITRRAALAGAVAMGAAVCGVAYADEAAWDAEADVVVIGAGAAGDMAALECALNQRLTVIQLEKLEYPIASSHLCGGDIVFCETDMEPGPREELVTDLIAAAQGDCQEDLLWSYVEAAPSVYEMMKGLGVEFSKTAQVAYMSRPWEHKVVGESGMSVMSVLEERIDECDAIELRMNNRARRLVVVEGRVAGVEVDAPEGTVRIGAKKGVFLGTGSFTRNPQLAKAFGRRGSEFIVATTGVGATGDGLLMGLAAGAGASYLGAGVTPTGPVGATTGQNCGPWMNNGAMMVGLNGKRFHNEGDNYVLITQDALALDQALFFQIYDTPMRHILEEWTGNPIFGLPAEPEIVGETLEELGENIKAAYPEFDAETMIASVQAYSQYVKDGFDPEFGRTNVSGTSGDLLPIEEGPFYAVPSAPGTTHFNGGLQIDASMRVVEGISGEPIPGLYAAGEVTGGFHGFGYMSATAFGKAIIHGVVAARTIAADAE